MAISREMVTQNHMIILVSQWYSITYAGAVNWDEFSEFCQATSGRGAELREDLDRIRTEMISEDEYLGENFEAFLLKFWEFVEYAAERDIFQQHKHAENWWWGTLGAGGSSFYKYSSGPPSLLSIEGLVGEEKFKQLAAGGTGGEGRGGALGKRRTGPVMVRPLEKRFPYLWQGLADGEYFWKISLDENPPKEHAKKLESIDARDDYMFRYLRSVDLELKTTTVEMEARNADALKELTREAPRNGRLHRRRLRVWQLGEEGGGVWIDDSPPARLRDDANFRKDFSATAELSIIRRMRGKNTIFVTYTRGRSDVRFDNLCNEILSAFSGDIIVTEMEGVKAGKQESGASGASGAVTKTRLDKAPPRARNISLEEISRASRLKSVQSLEFALKSKEETALKVLWFRAHAVGHVFCIVQNNADPKFFPINLLMAGFTWSEDDFPIGELSVNFTDRTCVVTVDRSFPPRSKFQEKLKEMIGAIFSGRVSVR
ncbi:hypothetical protein OHV05_37090 (plasmid) [Kitasatospora sp. NBC_00070]|uniref:hypothetical protein n=1 Tax=Kitasatospora sp. NBC_00070 TaxID=2975962 RepID=UPI00324919AF